MDGEDREHFDNAGAKSPRRIRYIVEGMKVLAKLESAMSERGDSP